MGEAKWTCVVCSVSVLPENWPNHLLGASHADHSRIGRDKALAAAPAPDAGLDVERLIASFIPEATYHGSEVIGRLRAALSRQAENETA